MAEATLKYETGEIKFTASAALTSGEVIKLADDRAGVVAGLKGFDSGEQATAYTKGVFEVDKAAVEITEGTQVLWDVSANNALPAGSGTLATGDFQIGLAVATAASGAAKVVVDLNAPSGVVTS